MTVVLGIVLPVFGLMLAGFVFARLGALDEAGVRGLSTFVFYAAIPALLFRSLAVGPGAAGAGLGVAYAYFGGCLAVFAAAMAIGRLVFAAPLEEQALLGLCASFSNSVQLGIPLAFAAFGPAGEGPALVIIAFHSVILISLATVLVELGLGKGNGPLRALAAVFRSVATNPIILAIVAGALWSRTGWALPSAAGEFLHLLASAASPCALFTLGASLAALELRGDLAETLAATALKLVALPLAVWLLARFVFALTAIEVAVATVIAAVPTGANAFILAQRYNLYLARAAGVVVLTTLAGVVTLSLVLAAMMRV